MAETGCEVTNELIGSYKGLSMIYGEASTGKTTLCKLAAIEYSKKGKVIFLDTENGFNTDRLKQMKDDFNNVLKKIVLIKAKSFYQQHIAIKDMHSLRGVSLVVVDTIGNHYRVHVKKDYKKANAILRKQVSLLKELSKTVPVIITTQVYSDIKSGLINPIGGKIVVNESDVVIRLDKNPRRIIIEKPFSKDMLFEINAKGMFKI